MAVDSALIIRFFKVFAIVFSVPVTLAAFGKLVTYLSSISELLGFVVAIAGVAAFVSAAWIATDPRRF